VSERRGHAQPDWPWPASLDALVAAPSSHGLLFENARVRVVEVTLEPGAREPEHTDRWPSVMIVDQPARIRYYRQGRPVSESPGVAPAHRPRVQWLDAERPHAVENLDSHPYHAIRVEIAPEPPAPRGAT